MKNLDQIDCVWLAKDRLGNVAAMVTAGAGPIPRDILDRGDVTQIESWLLTLPTVCGAEIQSDDPDTQSFSDLARRGLFVYDWTDVYRPISLEKRAYELVAKPELPAKIGDLPLKLHGLVWALDVHQMIGKSKLAIILDK